MTNKGDNKPILNYNPEKGLKEIDLPSDDEFEHIRLVYEVKLLSKKLLDFSEIRVERVKRWERITSIALVVINVILLILILLNLVLFLGVNKILIFDGDFWQKLMSDQWRNIIVTVLPMLLLFPVTIGFIVSNSRMRRILRSFNEVSLESDFLLLKSKLRTLVQKSEHSKKYRSHELRTDEAIFMAEEAFKAFEAFIHSRSKN